MAAANPGGSPPIGQHSYLEWAKMILNSLGYQDQANSEVALVCWMVKEGGTAGGESNPLNTKEPWPKAKQLPNGIYAYDSDDDGLAATVKTLKNGYYNAILTALKNNVDYVTTCRYVDSSKWGTKGATTVAIGVKASGGATGAIYLGYTRRNVPSKGHSVFSGVPVVGGVVSAADSVASGFGAIGDFLGVITDPHNWYRAAQILFGAISIALGIYLLSRNSPVGKLASAAGSGIGKASGPKTGKELTVA